jgi:Uma2 family endonuclease
VVELRSQSEALANVQATTQEYLDHGAQLGWLIAPVAKQVHVYRPQAAVEGLDNPQTVSGDPVLPGFVRGVGTVWDSERSDRRAI